MSLIIQTQVGPQQKNDGDNPIIRSGKASDLIVSELHGKYAEQTYRGNVYHGSTAAAGVLIPISTTTTPTFGLWNPAGSGKNANLIRVKVGFVSTTGAPGNVLYSALTGAGSAIGTAAPISAFTAGTPTNGLIGGGGASAMKFTPSAATLTAAGSIVATSGLSQLTTTGTAATGIMWQAQEDFDGMLTVPPGVFFYLTGSAALLSLFNITLVWEELPI